MKRYLAALDEKQPRRSSEEYLGAFSESLKIIHHENPVDRMGHAVLLAAKTALRLKATMPELKEHEIAGRLQTIARSTRLLDILQDLTPEEKRMIKWSDDQVELSFNSLAEKSTRKAAVAKPRPRQTRVLKRRRA